MAEILEQRREYEEQGDFAASSPIASGTSSDSGDSEGKRLKMIVIGIVAACIVLGVLIIVISIGAKNPDKPKKQKTTEATEEYIEYVFQYTYEELEALQLNGYTGRQIEEFQEMEVSADLLIAEAKADRQALYEAEIAPYRDSTSDEYKELLRSTWLGWDDLYLADPSQCGYFSDKYNLDFTKITPKGHQLWICLYLEDGTDYYMSVTPEQYLRLPQSGNIVVEITRVKQPDGSYIVTGAKELVY